MRSIYTILLAVYCISISSQGLKLFNPEIKEVVPKTQRVVMDFLERYFKELPSQKQTSIETKMADDKVYFRKGKLADLSQINDAMPFSITLLDRYYEVNWMKGDEPFVTIVFPAQYDLLFGLDKDKASKKFKDAVLSASQRTKETKAPSNLRKLNETLYMSQGDTLVLGSLSDALYYNKVQKNYQPVFDKKHLDYSAANLFHGLLPHADYKMYVEQSVYGMSTINYTITLNQWLNYCAEWNLKVFFAVEEEREDGILALVIAQSKELGYHHLLSVVIPDKFIEDQKAVLKVRLTPYIPTHNVKDLYQKQSKTHKKVKWQ
ncbi:MAG: hypothetical protein IKZ62_00955 [Prevotella sp.]|nr:hypothetical protein [Prevotella sp.]